MYRKPFAKDILLNDNGQIVIPKSFCKKLNIKKNSVIHLELTKKGVLIMKVITKTKIPVEHSLENTSKENQDKFIKAAIDVENENFISKEELNNILDDK